MGRSSHSQRLPARAPEVARDGVYTTRPEWTFAAESAWSRAAKFQWLNQLGTQELAIALGAHAQAPGSDGIDLRCSQSFDVGAMAQTLQVSRTSIVQSFCVQWRSDTLFDYCSRTLRFCPSCIRRAYHATFFQFRFVHRCPLHREALVRICPNCHSRIPYRLDRFLTKQPYACAICNRPLHGLRRVHHVRAIQTAMASDESELFGNWQRYLGVAVELHLGARRERPRNPGGHFVRFHDDAWTKSFISSFAFLRDLQDTYRQPPPLPTYVEAKSRELRLSNLAMGIEEQPRHSAQPFGQRWPHLPGDYAWYAQTYYNALRRFRRKISPIDARYWRAKRRSRTCVLAAHHCPVAVALAGWRLAWEGAARSLTSRRSLPLIGLLEWWAFAPLRPPATPIHVWHIVLRGWFKRDLQRLFDDWIDLAKWMQSRHVFLVNRQFLSPGMLWLDPDNPQRAPQVTGLHMPNQSHD